MGLSYTYLKGRDSYGGFMDWGKEFGHNGKVFLEIGIGNGEYITRRAGDDHQDSRIGIDCRWDCISKTLRRIQRERLENVRLFWLDARDTLIWFAAPRSLDGVEALFPCPWPKRRHLKYRLFSNDFLKLLNNRLKPQGRVLIVTDHAGYMTWLKEESPGTGFKLDIRTIPARYGTKYERKWQNEGQTEFYEIHLEKIKHENYSFAGPEKMKSYKIKDFCYEKFVPRDIRGEQTVIFKEMFFDAAKNKALVRAITSDEGLEQTVWIKIAFDGNIWHIGLEAGLSFIPTLAAAKSLEGVYSAAKASAS